MDETTAYDSGQTADTGGMGWEAFGNWLSNSSDKLLNVGGQYLLNSQQIQARQNAMQLSSLGTNGYYFDGMTGTYRQVPGTVAGLGMSSGTLLLLGGAVLVFMLMKE